MISSPGSTTGKHDTAGTTGERSRRIGNIYGPGGGKHARDNHPAPAPAPGREEKGTTSPRLTLKFQHIKGEKSRGGAGGGAGGGGREGSGGSGGGGSDTHHHHHHHGHHHHHAPLKAKHPGARDRDAHHYKSYSVTLASEDSATSDCKRPKYTTARPVSPTTSTSSQDSSDLYEGSNTKLDGVASCKSNSSNKGSSAGGYGRSNRASNSVFGNKMENHSGKENEKRSADSAGRFSSQFEDISDDEDAPPQPPAPPRGKDSSAAGSSASSRKDETMEAADTPGGAQPQHSPPAPASSIRLRASLAPTPSAARNSTPSNSNSASQQPSAPSTKSSTHHPVSSSTAKSSTTHAHSTPASYIPHSVTSAPNPTSHVPSSTSSGGGSAIAGSNTAASSSGSVVSNTHALTAPSAVATNSSAATASHMSRRPLYSQHKSDHFTHSSAGSSKTGGGNAQSNSSSLSSVKQSHHSSSYHGHSASSSDSNSSSGSHHHKPVYASACSSSSSSNSSSHSSNSSSQHHSATSSSNLQQQHSATTSSSAALSEQEKIRLDKQRESQRLYQFEDEFSDKEDTPTPSRLRPEKTSPKSSVSAAASSSDNNTSSSGFSNSKDNTGSSKLSPKFDSLRENRSPKSDISLRLSPKYGGGDAKMFGSKAEKETRTLSSRLDREAKAASSAEGKVSPKPERHSPKLDKEKENGRVSSFSSSNSGNNKPDSSSAGGNGNNNGNSHSHSRTSPKLEPTSSSSSGKLSPKSENGNGSGSGRSSPKVPPLKIILPAGKTGAAGGPGSGGGGAQSSGTTTASGGGGDSLKTLLMKPALPYVLNPTQDGGAASSTTARYVRWKIQSVCLSTSKPHTCVMCGPFPKFATRCSTGHNKACE